MPTYLPYDPKTKLLISDVGKYLRRRHHARLIAYLRKDSLRYGWIDGDISWTHSAALGSDTDPALDKLQNFALRARRRLFLDKQTQLSRQDLSYWKDRYKDRVSDDKCDSCGEVETRFHFCVCRTHNPKRRQITGRVLEIINEHLTEKITDLPVFWAPEQRHQVIPADQADLWKTIEALPTERAAMGIIPLSFINYLNTLPWAAANKASINITKEIQIEIVQGFLDCWKQRCIHRFGMTGPERAARVAKKIEVRTKRRAGKEQRTKERRARYEKQQRQQQRTPRQTHRSMTKRTARPDEEPPP